MFWHTSIQGCKEECKVPVGREFIRIPVSVLWFRASFADFYKSTNNTKSIVKVNQYQDNYISWGAYLLMSQKFSELIPVRKNIYFFIAKSGFCNKFEEIPIDTSKEDRDSWSDNQLKVNDFNFVQEINYRFSKQACNQ